MADLSIPKRGVYAITCLVDGRCYVGGSTGIVRRWSAHRSALNHGKHKNRLLQEAWTQLGPEAFAFSVLEAVPTGSISEVEQRHMDRLCAHSRGFNIYPTAGSPRGSVHSAETRMKVGLAGRGRKHSTASRAKISDRLREVMTSSDARAIRSAGVIGQRNGCAKLSDRDIIAIRQAARGGATQQAIADRFGIKQQAVSKIVSRQRWAHIA